jgi:hypothetical protein
VKLARASLACAALAACFDATGVVLRAQVDGGGDAQSIVEAGAPPSVRFAYVAVDAGPLRFCATAVGASAPALNVSVTQLQVTAPTTLDAGTYDFAVASAALPTCTTPLAEALDHTLAQGAHTVALIGDPPQADGGTPARPLTLVVLDDEAPSGVGAALRPFDVATLEASMSLTLDDAGATPLSYGALVSSNGYLSIVAGAHDATLAWGGSDSFAIAAQSGGRYSLFAIDGPGITPNQEVMALVCDDLAFDGGFTSCSVR